LPDAFVRTSGADSSPDTDDELVRRYVRTGDPEAFRLIYERYRRKVYSTAWQVTGDANEALDVAQEVFLRLHRKMDRFRFESSFSSWLYRMTVNLATDFRRRRRAHRTLSIEGFARDTDSPLAVPSDAPGPVARAAQHELASDVLDALDALSPRLKQVVVLRYMQHLSYEEIAEIIGKPTGTVKSRLNRAHDKLKPVLENLTGEQP